MSPLSLNPISPAPPVLLPPATVADFASEIPRGVVRRGRVSLQALAPTVPVGPVVDGRMTTIRGAEMNAAILTEVTGVALRAEARDHSLVTHEEIALQ